MVRQRSTHRLAYWSIAGMTLDIWLFWSHLPVFVNIYPIYSTYLLCYYPPGAYRFFVSITGFVVNTCLVPLLLDIYSMLIVKSLRRGGIHSVQTDLVAMNTRQSKDHQVSIMLLVEIFVYLPMNTLWGVYSLYRNSNQYQLKSVEQQTLELSLATLFYLLTFIVPAINVYLHLAVSKTFREKAAQISLKLCQHPSIHAGRKQVIPVGVITRRTSQH